MKLSAPLTRRERFRQITMDEIKTIARRQMEEHGPAGISLNAIARAMEISGPALYRYFASRDDLITALILDASNALAETLESAASGNSSAQLGDRLLAVLLAYRRWAVDHPFEFQLIFAHPFPGHGEPDDITTAGAQKVLTPILQILAVCFEQGELQSLTGTLDLPDELQATLKFTSRELPAAIPPEVIYTGLVSWYPIHGMIMLELFNHSTSLIHDPALFYRHEVLRLLESMNLHLSKGK